MQCENCKLEIDDEKAKRCPHCKKRLNPCYVWLAILITLISVAVVACIVYVIMILVFGIIVIYYFTANGGL